MSVDGRSPRPRRRKPEATALLIRVAHELFEQSGVSAVSVEEITSAAGMAKPRLYLHFKSKDALVLACVTAEADRQRRALQSALANAPLGPMERLKAVAQVLVNDVRTGGHRGLFLDNAALDFADPDHPVRLATARAAQDIRDLLSLILEPAVGEHAPALALMFHFLVLGAATAAASLGRDAAADALESAIAQACAAHAIASAP